MQPPFFVELDTPAVLIGSRFALHTKHRVMSGFFILGARPVRLHGRKIGDVLRHKLHALAPVTLLGRGLRLQARLIARRAAMRAQQLRSDHRAHVCVEVRRTTHSSSMHKRRRALSTPALVKRDYGPRGDFWLPRVDHTITTQGGSGRRVPEALLPATQFLLRPTRVLPSCPHSPA